jgi:hypothetical protein
MTAPSGNEDASKIELARITALTRRSIAAKHIAGCLCRQRGHQTETAASADQVDEVESQRGFACERRKGCGRDVPGRHLNAQR